MWPHAVEVLKLDQDQTFRSKPTKKEVVKKGSGIEFLKNGAQPPLCCAQHATHPATLLPWMKPTEERRLIETFSKSVKWSGNAKGIGETLRFFPQWIIVLTTRAGPSEPHGWRMKWAALTNDRFRHLGHVPSVSVCRKCQRLVISSGALLRRRIWGESRVSAPLRS